MGECCSTADPKDRELKATLQSEAEADTKVIKLLLLGAGASGKSTLFKQLQYIHENGFNRRSRKLYIRKVHSQLIESMKSLIVKCEEYYENDPKANVAFRLYNYYDEDLNLSYDDNNNNIREEEEDLLGTNKNNLMHVNDASVSDNDYEDGDDDDDDARYGQESKMQMAAEQVLSQLSTRNTSQLSQNKSLIQSLRLLWNSTAIQAMFNKRNEICVADSTAYFYEHLDRVTSEDYTPTDDDLLLVRSKTIGMQEKNFTVKGNQFKICDVGGQRNERRKWIHFFDNVTAVLFVVSLSCYDEVIFECEENAMMESICIFRQQMESETFAHTPFILFMNKSDLFSIKIQSVPITVAECFSTYDGPPHDEMLALDYMKAGFTAISTNKDRQVFVHVTCATDRTQIEKVFNDVQTMILNWSLEQTGII